MKPIDDSMVSRWDILHADPRFCPRYPNELVVRWVFGSFPDRANNRYSMLDLGCGAGRHSVFLAKEGFDVTACDFSKTGLIETQSRCRIENLIVRTPLCESDALPFEANTFAGVLCYGVLYYMTPGRFRVAASEIFRVLKAGGKALVLTRTDADSRFVFTNREKDQSSRVGRLPESAPANTEEGMVMTFLNRSDVEELFPGAMVERTTYAYQDGCFTDDDWVIHIRKAAE